MRKLQKVAIVVAAVGSLVTVGAGTSFADAPVDYQGQNGMQPQTVPPASAMRAVPQPAPQPAPQMAAAQAVAPQPAPQAMVQQAMAPQPAMAPQQAMAPQPAARPAMAPQPAAQQPAAPQPAPQMAAAQAVAPQSAPQAAPRTATGQMVGQAGVQQTRGTGAEREEADTYNIFHPEQECSPQELVHADVPIGVLSQAETHGYSCVQPNAAFNKFED
ncbi:hypothetical protein [Streptomyces palmae]|uniref:Uncharacterized protein n=1 Tax=Streptomyces palmae TaxID=1701085 RepID=A0A4Z0HA33_9ACTN|nr:hypothetical protein [Streptomyces palmae]TGB10464.1 hypothetical protein E4099_12795 [Streptomyces palmae]